LRKNHTPYRDPSETASKEWERAPLAAEQEDREPSTSKPRQSDWRKEMQEAVDKSVEEKLETVFGQLEEVRG